jgi:predicted Zn-dependent peptidase
MVIGQESVSNRMYHLAYDELYRGRFCSLDEEVARVMAVTREDVADAAKQFLDPATFAVTALGPESGEPISEADWPVRD